MSTDQVQCAAQTEFVAVGKEGWGHGHLFEPRTLSGWALFSDFASTILDMFGCHKLVMWLGIVWPFCVFAIFSQISGPIHTGCGTRHAHKFLWCWLHAGWTPPFTSTGSVAHPSRVLCGLGLRKKGVMVKIVQTCEAKRPTFRLSCLGSEVGYQNRNASGVCGNLQRPSREPNTFLPKYSRSFLAQISLFSICEPGFKFKDILGVPMLGVMTDWPSWLTIEISSFTIAQVNTMCAWCVNI